MTVLLRHAAEPAAAVLHGWRRPWAWLAAEVPGGPVFAAVLLAALGVGAADARFRAWFADAVRRALFTSVQALMALAVFVALVLAAYWGLRWAWRRAGRRGDRVLPGIIGFLLLVLGLNALPIVSYIEIFSGLGWPPFFTAVASLLLANAMLYFFFNRFLAAAWGEVHRLYARSATYKGARPIDYAAEALHWEFLNTLKPIYLYLFSFTLFTDYWLEAQRTHFGGGGDGPALGILGHLFKLITHEGWRAEVWIGLVALWLVIWPQRTLLDWLARRWECRRNLG